MWKNHNDYTDYLTKIDRQLTQYTQKNAAVRIPPNGCKFSTFNSQFSIFHAYSADRNAASVAIYAPTVFLNTVYAVGVGADIVGFYAYN